MESNLVCVLHIYKTNVHPDHMHNMRLETHFVKRKWKL